MRYVGDDSDNEIDTDEYVEGDDVSECDQEQPAVRRKVAPAAATLRKVDPKPVDSKPVELEPTPMDCPPMVCPSHAPMHPPTPQLSHVLLCP